MLNLGTVPANSTLYIPFATYGKTNGESITMTGLAVTDIEIYKNGSATQRASDSGYALLDTDGIDFNGITGIHGFSVDLSDNTDAGFYAVGSWYWAVVSSITVDSQTINFIAAVFRIVPAESVTGYAKADTSHIAGTAVNTATAQIGANVVSVAANAITATAIADGAIDAATFAAGAIDAAAIATDAIDADALKTDAVTEIVNALLAGVIEGTYTLAQVQRVLLSALAGKSSGIGTATVKTRDTGDTKDRITATIDASGNRTAVTIVET